MITSPVETRRVKSWTSNPPIIAHQELSILCLTQMKCLTITPKRRIKMSTKLVSYPKCLTGSKLSTQLEIELNWPSISWHFWMAQQKLLDKICNCQDMHYTQTIGCSILKNRLMQWSQGTAMTGLRKFCVFPQAQWQISRAEQAHTEDDAT